jgi:phosphoglycerate dehydrogenase-like enzyme
VPTTLEEKYASLKVLRRGRPAAGTHGGGVGYGRAVTAGTNPVAEVSSGGLAKGMCAVAMRNVLVRCALVRLVTAAVLATSAVGGPLARAAGPAPGPDPDTARLIERLGLEESATPVRERPGWKKPRTIVVIAGRSDLVALLQPVAPGVRFLPARTEEEAARLARDADAVLGYCTPEVLAAGRRVRWVQTYYAGVEDCVSIPALAQRDVLLTNMQRVAGPVMAEHVLAMMFAFARGLDFYIPEHASQRWTPDSPVTKRMATLEGKHVLVVGLGGIGTEVARKAHALGMTVEAIRASGRDGPEYVARVGLPGELLEYAARADYVVNTTPLTPETHGLFDAKFFAAMKPQAYFLNVGRGQSVVQEALVAALRSGRLAGAGLDVTEPEPLPAGDPLWTLPNVILTPHVSSRSDLGESVRLAILRENVRRYVAGERMLSVVDLKRGY